MPVNDIKELRLLPPLAIGRFGSSTEPMENYEVQVNEADIAGFRKLLPAETLVVDRATGEVTEAITPSAVRFRDAAGNIKPVSPFLELWGRLDDNDSLEPLTKTHLTDLGLTWLGGCERAITKCSVVPAIPTTRLKPIPDRSATTP